MENLTKKILVTIPVAKEHKTYLERQAAAGESKCLFSYVPGKEATEADVAEANVIIGNLSPELIKKAESLEWLQLNSAGADQYVKPGILKPGVMLTNATGAYGLAVSEHMLAMTFDLIRHFHLYRDNQKKHIWKSMGNIISVAGSTILVLGIGDIGGDYAKKVKALGAYVIGVRRTAKEKPDYLDEQYTLEELDGLLGRADIVAMVLPGGEATHHLMDERRLGLMKPGAYLLNVGRGNAVDPAALKEALQNGHLGGCALDVTEPEPLLKDSELWDVERLLITPHVAGNFFLRETFERIVRIAGRNLEAWVLNKDLENQVDFETGYKK